MSKDSDGTPRAHEGSTLRAFLIAALFMASGLALLGWDNKIATADAKPLIQVSQSR